MNDLTVMANWSSYSKKFYSSLNGTGISKKGFENSLKYSMTNNVSKKG